LVRISNAKFVVIKAPTPSLAPCRNVQSSKHPVEQIPSPTHIFIAVLELGAVVKLVHYRGTEEDV
jgi:hypothetical protein